ncbi:MAG: hypothetical protein Q7S21_06700 [archaeon]|nr:hypothetical protein [archaeon]
MNKEKQIEKEIDAIDKAFNSVKKWNSGFPAKTSQEFMCSCGCGKD